MSYKMTVIVPSYNNGQYISQCLDSILNQKTDFTYQIIITDDASEDNSQEIIKSYEEKYPDRIVALYSEENCQLFRNVLKALEIMDSEYYCVLDPDDYWTDMYRLQKAVDFLDNNKDYTIYASNMEILYNDGSRKIKYDLGRLKSKTSTYEDYLNGRAVLSSTSASTYRNVWFNNGIPKEFYALKGSIYEYSFRADSARNVMHLVKGKIYFENEVVAVYRYHEKGIFSGLPMAERYIQMAFAYIAYYEYFGKEHYHEYRRKVFSAYTQTLKELYRGSLNGMVMTMRPKWQNYYDLVVQWLQENEGEERKPRLAFSLPTFSRLASDKVIIWGTGAGAERVLEKYGIGAFLDNIICFVDNNKNKHGTEFMGKPVVAPDVMKQEQDFVLLIASSYHEQIIEQIRAEELCPETDVVNLYDYDKNWC